MEASADQMDRVKGKATKSTDGVGHVCSACDMTFPTLPKLKYHRMKTHGAWKESLACPDCHRTYGSTSNLKRHRARAHDANGQGDEAKEKAWTCSECGHVSQDRFHAIVHERKHTGERPFVCRQCPAAFMKKSDLKTHEKRCNGPRHTCPRCNEHFVFRRQFEEHCVWSETCGSLARASVGSHEEIAATASAKDHSVGTGRRLQRSRYMSAAPSAVKLTLGGGRSMVAVGSKDMVGGDVAELSAKGKRRIACGLCFACERHRDCGRCKPCRANPTASNRRRCAQRKCLCLLPVYRAVESDIGANQRRQDLLQHI